MIAKFFIIFAIAIAACNASVIPVGAPAALVAPAFAPAAYVAPYASSYSAHTVNHAVATPVVSPARLVAAPAPLVAAAPAPLVAAAPAPLVAAPGPAPLVAAPGYFPSARYFSSPYYL